MWVHTEIVKILGVDLYVFFDTSSVSVYDRKTHYGVI